MFESAERLHGIYKTNDVTKSVTIDPKAFHLGMAPQQPQHAAIVVAEGVVPAATPMQAKKARSAAASDKGKEEADEEESSSLREITNN